MTRRSILHRPSPLLLATTVGVAAGLVGLAGLAGCDREEDAMVPAAGEHHDGMADDDHADDHADDHDHDGEAGHDHDHEHAGMSGEDPHDEVPLGTIELDGLTLELAQGHGEIAPGKELHLVVKPTPDDGGASVVRAWLGTEDRLSALVARGTYAASHGDYDLHAVAPDPLPEDVRWWIEVERPDGTVLTGSIAPR